MVALMGFIFVTSNFCLYYPMIALLPFLVINLFAVSVDV